MRCTQAGELVWSTGCRMMAEIAGQRSTVQRQDGACRRQSAAQPASEQMTPVQQCNTRTRHE